MQVRRFWPDVAVRDVKYYLDKVMQSEKLSRDERLSGEAIKRLFREGKRAKGANVTLIYLPKKTDAEASCLQKSEIAVVIPKKVYKKAFQRNRMKRLYREIFRRNKSHFPTPYQYVFYQTQAPKINSFKAVRDEVFGLVKKIAN